MLSGPDQPRGATEPDFDPFLIAALLAIAGPRLGGACLTCQPGPQWDRWLAALCSLLPDRERPLTVPPRTGAPELAGGLDLPATLRLGRPVRQPGLLEAHRGRPLLLLAAERWTPSSAAILIAASDGLSISPTASTDQGPWFIARNECLGPDESPPAILLERLAIHAHLIDTPRLPPDLPTDWFEKVAHARVRLAQVVVPEPIVTSLVTCAAALGVASSRTDLGAVEVARAHAAWRGAAVANEEDAEVAARLVLVPRAKAWPAEANAVTAEPQTAQQEPEPAAPHDSTGESGEAAGVSALADRIIAVAAAALPPDVLDKLCPDRPRPTTRAGAGGRSKGPKRRARHGRPIGVAPGDPRRDGPLHLLATMTVAAPWQLVRRQLASRSSKRLKTGRRLIVMPSDLRVRRFKREATATMVFAVDASGSSALHRLGEAKGAVELLLKACYVRRDRVALVAFRGRDAETILPPTRALARARRLLGGLAGGGATPIAAGLHRACEIALAERRAGHKSLLVVLSDGRANVDRAGTADRQGAVADALAGAQRIAREGLAAILIDTAPQPGRQAAALAAAMGARYVPLPHADAHGIAAMVSHGRANLMDVPAAVGSARDRGRMPF